MRLHLWAYGRIGSGAEAELVERYRKRLDWRLSITELRDGAPLPWPNGGDARMVLLDERGQSLGSVDFAQRIGGWRNDGVRDVHLAIGPADGFTDEQRARADLLLAFGAMTWPHLLARAMLLEQVYRASTILSNHPYHREG